MWEFVINLLEVAILFLLFNTKLEKRIILFLSAPNSLFILTGIFVAYSEKIFMFDYFYPVVFYWNSFLYGFYSLRISRSHYFLVCPLCRRNHSCRCCDHDCSNCILGY